MRRVAAGLVALFGFTCAIPVAAAQPSAAPTQRILNAVSATAADDVWAVGSDGSGTLIRHWNGSRWSDVPSASQGLFTGVSARSQTDAWAVGYVFEGPAGAPTLIEHWDGTKWTVVPSPSPAAQNSLFGVAAVAADDAWAVGNSGSNALILHWDGKKWRSVTAPATSGGAGLSAVTASSATNVWAVGSAGKSTLIEHWNGTSWKRVKSPTPDSGDVLSGVAAASASRVYAVGNNSDGTKTLFLRWNGTRWRSQPGRSAGLLSAVSARSNRNVWAVGQKCCTSGGGAKTLTEHWNGQRWKIVASPDPSSSGDVLTGVTAVHVGKKPWAVGNTGHSDGGAGVLALHWTGTRWVSK